MLLSCFLHLTPKFARSLGNNLTILVCNFRRVHHFYFIYAFLCCYFDRSMHYMEIDLFGTLLKMFDFPKSEIAKCCPIRRAVILNKLAIFPVSNECFPYTYIAYAIKQKNRLQNDQLWEKWKLHFNFCWLLWVTFYNFTIKICSSCCMPIDKLRTHWIESSVFRICEGFIGMSMSMRMRMCMCIWQYGTNTSNIAS